MLQRSRQAGFSSSRALEQDDAFACVNLDLIMNRKKQRTVRFRRVRFSMRHSAVTSGCGEPKRFARSANAHLNDDETVAKMGHPVVVARLDVGHPSGQILRRAALCFG